MTSQLNNGNENLDQVLQETDSMRPLFFESSAKHSLPPASEQPQRSRLDSAVEPQHLPLQQVRPSDDNQHILTSLTPSETTLLDINHLLILQHHHLQTVDSGSVVQSVIQSGGGDAVVSGASGHFLLQLKESPKQRKNSLPRAPHMVKKAGRLPLSLPSASSATASKTPKLYRRFRSRSLPIINYTSRSQIAQPQTFSRMGGAVPNAALIPGASSGAASSAKAAGLSSSAPSGHHHHSRVSKTTGHSSHHSMYRHIPSFNLAPSLPPINLQSLKEIDLQEILKNPQLRHDILFDPQLQFRPNLDGERGRRKKTVIERYWIEIEIECKQFFDRSAGAQSATAAASTDSGSQLKVTRLRALFTTLREILLSLLPMKDRSPVNEIMDIDLIVQQLNYGLFDFVAMAKWLGDVFKSHCAPMRDLWVLDMINKFQQAFDEASVSKLVDGLRSIFSILEAMKLDVANHQIRILRPVLIETATDFEKDYFHQLITHCKIDISDSLKWFHRGYAKRQEQLSAGAGQLTIVPSHEMKSVLSHLVIELLSCRNMATEFPSTLAFDHTRLVLLRADVRQLVCVQLCIVLFKQVCTNYAAMMKRPVNLRPETITKVQEQILAIVTDDNGNVKWTRNVQAIALQLVKNAVARDGDAENMSVQKTNLPQHLVDFCYNWLIKQIQPNTDVYGLMEEKVFKELSEQIGRLAQNDPSLSAASSSSGLSLSSSASSGSDGATPKPTGINLLKQRKTDSEMAGISFRIYTLVKFHWSVFGDYYAEFERSHQPTTH
ncbi:hypothetical protein PUMCH_003442 [Australozyma saopauloensis]|uniref:Protein SOK1 n=1 Tax=Australozyma saopauloensis TaxID=291208 RepID=A0AAX4HDY1_9ASCO|nr:hypothetical protein PUMCH_003442 [[Candida] saopauloensis]